MKTSLLNEDSMRELGFTDHVKDRWYYCTRVDDATTLNITIDKETGIYKTEVLNEYFLQPEFYYSMMRMRFKNKIINNIDNVLENFRNAGLVIEHDHTQW